MYQRNYLIHRLRQSSLGQSYSGRKDAIFARILNNGTSHNSTSNNTTVSYDELFRQAEKIASVLVRHGVKVGDRVAVQGEKSVEQIQLYLATIMAAAVFLPLNPAYTTQETEYFLENASPRILICDPTREDVYDSVKGKYDIQHLFTLNADGTGSLSDKISEASPGFQAIARDRHDLAALLYTSGTTGRAKGAMLSHDNLWSNCHSLYKTWQFSKTDILIHALPIFHSHGLFVAINTTLTAGSSLFLLPKFDADAIMQLLPQASVLMGVPTFYTRLLKQEKLNKDYVASMRLFISGSAPLLAETHHQWYEKTGHAILERYGLTETNMNTSNPYDGKRRAGTVGLPLDKVEIRIVDDKTGQPLQDGKIGSIEVRGPNVFRGYWQRPDKTSEALRENGFFITGDMGKIDKHGYITLSGRSKDLIISGGFNVYPKEIELLIDEMESVHESAVIGVPHPDLGEAVVALIVPQPGIKPGTDDFKDHLQNNLAKYKQPKKYILLEELPRNTMGKVQKNLLRADHKEVFYEEVPSPSKIALPTSV